MPLTEIQLPVKSELYRDIQMLAGRIRSDIERYRLIADFIADVDTADMDAIGIPAGGG